MNKAHRDRIAFLRITSGKFTRGMEVYHVQGGKKIKLAQSTQLMAQDRATVEEAYAGDIVGLFDPGIFSIGDTLCNGKDKFQFEGIPTFAPEHFARVTQVDTMKRKQFVKGIEQIAQEGAIQIFRELNGGMEEVIVGVVGVLQFEVLEYRLKNEYNVDIRMQTLPYEHIRWIENTDLDPKTLDLTSDTKRIEDLKGNKLILFSSPWSINWALQHNEGLQLSSLAEVNKQKGTMQLLHRAFFLFLTYIVDSHMVIFKLGCQLSRHLTGYFWHIPTIEFTLFYTVLQFLSLWYLAKTIFHLLATCGLPPLAKPPC